jgi:hypothetical protein
MDRFDQKFAITNKGLRIEAILTVEHDSFVLNLQCFDISIQALNSVELVGTYLTRPLEALSGQGQADCSLRAVLSGILGNQHLRGYTRP